MVGSFCGGLNADTPPPTKTVQRGRKYSLKKLPATSFNWAVERWATSTPLCSCSTCSSRVAAPVCGLYSYTTNLPSSTATETMDGVPKDAVGPEGTSKRDLPTSTLGRFF